MPVRVSSLFIGWGLGANQLVRFEHGWDFDRRLEVKWISMWPPQPLDCRSGFHVLIRSVVI
jgi:hypothetical protein